MLFKNKLRYIIALAFLSLFSSCKEDLLDVTATDRISDDAILADSTLFEAYVINRYMGVKLQDKEAEGTPPGFGRGFEYGLWSSITDESMYTNDDNTWLIQRGQLSPENTGIAGTIWYDLGLGYPRIIVNFTEWNLVSASFTPSLCLRKKNHQLQICLQRS